MWRARFWRCTAQDACALGAAGAWACDGVKCMSCDLNVCMSVSCQTVRSDAAEVGAERCGAERRIRSGAMTILRRSVASTNTIQKCLPINKHVIISTILGRISCALGPYRSPDISSAIEQPIPAADVQVRVPFGRELPVAPPEPIFHPSPLDVGTCTIILATECRGTPSA